MKKMLIGPIANGKGGGLDQYIMTFYQTFGDRIQIDFYSKEYSQELAEMFAKKGSKLYQISSLKHPFRQYWKLRKILSQGKYDILYMQTSTSITFPVLKAARDAGVKSILVHSHSSGVAGGNPMKRELVSAAHHLCKGFLCRYATDFFACSDKAAQWMYTKKVFDGGKVRRIQNVVDTSRFLFDANKRAEIRKNLNIDDRFVVGIVGNLVYVKNHLFLLDAFAEAAKQEENMILVIAGEGVMRKELEKKVERLQIKDRVIFLGRVNSSDGYMSAFDLFVLPSYFEGMPIVAVEAQCAGLSCIFSDRITREADITKRCRFLPINDPTVWAREILSSKQTAKERRGSTINLFPYSLQALVEAFDWLIEGEHSND